MRRMAPLNAYLATMSRASNNVEAKVILEERQHEPRPALLTGGVQPHAVLLTRDHPAQGPVLAQMRDGIGFQALKAQAVPSCGNGGRGRSPHPAPRKKCHHPPRPTAA